MAKNMHIVVILIVIALALFVVFGFFGIGGFSLFPTTTQGTQTPAQQLLTDIQQQGGVTQLEAADVQPGSGDAYGPGDTIQVSYTGVLPNGTVFDSTDAHGGVPLTLVIAADGTLHTPDGGGLIAGWSQGMAGMKEGGRRIIAIPPSLGYGAQSAGLIPPNSTLVFDIQLLSVTHQGAGAAPTSPTGTPEPQ
jgi:FKBP-type peptidyl-prolyl cis-trans isomerase